MGYSVSSEMRPVAGRTSASKLLIAALGAMLLLGVAAGAAQAATLSGTPIAWDEAPNDCSGSEALELEPGEMLWYFVLTAPTSSGGNLVVTFESAPEEAIPGAAAGSETHFMTITNHPEVLLSASTLGVDGESISLSHVCAMEVADPFPEPSSEPTAEPTAQPTAEPTAEPTAKPTTKPTSKPTAEATPKSTPRPSPTPAPTEKQTSQPTPPGTEAETPSAEPTPVATQHPTPTPEPATQAPSPDPTEQPRPTPTPEPTAEAEPALEPEPTDTPLPAIVLPTSNEPPTASGLDPLYVVVAAGLLVGLLTVVITLRGSLRRGPLERVLG